MSDKHLDKELFAKNLIYLRNEARLTQTQLSKILGVTQTSVSEWEKGIKAPRNFGLLKSIADLFKTSADELLFQDLKTKKLSGEYSQHPANQRLMVCKNSPSHSYQADSNRKPLVVYGKVCAGDGFEAFEEPIDEITNPYHQIRGDLFALQVHGDSMNNVVNDGMYAIIEKKTIVNNGEVAVMLIDNEVGMLKRFYRLDDMVILRPDSSNPDHKPLTFVGEEINSLKILGRYLGCVSPMENLL